MRRPMSHRRNERIVKATAEMVGVPVDHFLEVIALRKRARYLAYHRRRAILEKPRMTKKKMGPRQMRREAFAPHSELYGLLKANNMTIGQFLELAGISQSAFYQWYGFPMYKWPIMLLRYKAWADNMAAHLEKQGMDVRRFLPELPKLDHNSQRAREHRNMKFEGID